MGAREARNCAHRVRIQALDMDNLQTNRINNCYEQALAAQAAAFKAQHVESPEDAIKRARDMLDKAESLHKQALETEKKTTNYYCTQSTKFRKERDAARLLAAVFFFVGVVAVVTWLTT